MRLSLTQAISRLQSGEVVAVPTETVYGLAASLHHPPAIEQLFVLKGRPRTNPLIIHLADAKDIQAYVTHYPPGFEDLSHAFWPGPLTCVLPVQPSCVPASVRADLPTAGFRVPKLDITRHLLKETGPLVMPSANLSGRPSATQPKHVEEDFGAHFPVLEGGTCAQGLESTILLYRDERWWIARLGALAAECFLPILDYQPLVLQNEPHAQPLCPGQLFRHYAPRAHLYLGDVEAFKDTSFIVGFKERDYPLEKRILLLGSLENPEEVAENLYHILRQLDQEGASHAWVDMHFPRHGLWQTIAERLLRAGKKD